jgi:tRNA(Leu) C34 or U34 (ribose-2'-O)-methylase TrmL
MDENGQTATVKTKGTTMILPAKIFWTSAIFYNELWFGKTRRTSLQLLLCSGNRAFTICSFCYLVDMVMSKRGFFAIGVYHPKTETNIGTLIRSSYSFGANHVFTIGRRYKKQSSAVGLHKHIPIYNYLTYKGWKNHIPYDCIPVAVELNDKAKPIKEFYHPERAIYLLGAEDNGLSENILKEMQVVQLPGKYCLNVATAGSIVMYDRIIKRGDL